MRHQFKKNEVLGPFDKVTTPVSKARTGVLRNSSFRFLIDVSVLLSSYFFSSCIQLEALLVLEDRENGLPQQLI